MGANQQSQRVDRCPCGTGRRYPDCCGPYVDDGVPALTAEEVMRSRYTAYTQRRADHLLRTWHPSTRPEDLSLDRGVIWEGLEVVDRQGGQIDDEEGIVEFRARWRRAVGGPGAPDTPGAPGVPGHSAARGAPDAPAAKRHPTRRNGRSAGRQTGSAPALPPLGSLTGVMTERSVFRRRGGRWLYVHAGEHEEL